jgi:predicted nucleotidyltransferase
MLEEVKKRLIRTYNPIEIYVFGSYAWGYHDDESDLDLLVVIDKFTNDRQRLLVEGQKALIDLDLSKDLLVISKEEFDQYSNDPRRIYYKIRQQGKKIYARACIYKSLPRFMFV